MSGVNTASASFNRTVNDKASWAVSAQLVDYGKMKETDENNIQMGEFSAKDIAIAGYFSYMLGEKFAGGIAAKFITSYILSLWEWIWASTITTRKRNGRFHVQQRIWVDS